MEQHLVQYNNTSLSGGDNSLNTQAGENFTERNKDNNSFDILVWVMKFLRYWYLFVISIAAFLSISYLQNRKWQPEYHLEAQVLIQDGQQNFGYSGSMDQTMQGFNVQSSYRNVNNQLVMFGSHELVGKAIDKLPFIIDCYTRGKFKTNDLYKIAPADIKYSFVSPDAYGNEYTIKDSGDGYVISWMRGDVEHHIAGVYGRLLQCSQFFILVNRSDMFTPGYKFYFRFNKRDDLVNEYCGRLAFDFVLKGSSVISVTLTSTTAQKDIDFIDTLCATFIEENLAKKNEVATKTIDFINEQMATISDSLSKSEEVLKDYRISNQIVDISSHSGDIIADSRTIQNNMAAFRLKESYFNYITKYLHRNKQDDVIALPSTLGISDEVLNKYVGMYNDLIDKKQQVGVKNPYFGKYTNELTTLRKTMLAVVHNMRASLDIEKADLMDKNKEVNQKIAKLPTQENSMSNYQRRFQINDNYYAFLLQKRAESQVQKASNTPDNILLDNARIIELTNSSARGKTRLFYLFIGFLLPFLFVLIKTLLNNKIIEKRDVENNSPFAYLGSVRHTNSKDPVSVQNNPRSSLAESYRVIRTRVEFIIQRQYPSHIMVTSTESGDGKTTFSTNMASMYALTGRKTLLIDLDLRKPSILKKLHIPQEHGYGISNYLAMPDYPFEDLIIHDDRYKFDIIAGGTVPPNPGELIRSKKLNDLYERLCGMYDHIVIDTSPIGLVADAYSLIHQVDVTLFVARYEKTNKLFFRSILQQLKSDMTPNVFVVLNDVDDKKTNYSNYHEYGRRAYYMKKDDYHSYTKDYLNEEEERASEKRENGWRRFFPFVK